MYVDKQYGRKVLNMNMIIHFDNGETVEIALNPGSEKMEYDRIKKCIDDDGNYALTFRKDGKDTGYFVAHPLKINYVEIKEKPADK